MFLAQDTKFMGGGLVVFANQYRLPINSVYDLPIILTEVGTASPSLHLDVLNNKMFPISVPTHTPPCVLVFVKKNITE